MGTLQALADVIAGRDEDTHTAPYVPQAEVVPPSVEKFIDTARAQYGTTFEQLIVSAKLLEAKAAELRRRADQVKTDFLFMSNTIKQAVAYEEECRHVAQSLSMIPLKEGE